ncbi:MAG: macro domain-containing protein [Candidatus Kapaibacterium sp.]|jgi:O-acetyl-ADP-ribose deacetylase (regulator of RNase III)|nr:macro domain-containing protein [Candidatus Kapabacteria bacterium]
MKFTTGNIFDCNAEALVNTVNTVGVMGKGLALQFKERFPENYQLYKAACKNDEVQVGKMFITSTNSIIPPNWIINFPTKKHWMHQSSYEYIEKGLEDLVVQIRRLGIQSVALPPLGVGQGGLEWERVKRLILLKLESLETDITVFEPYPTISKVSYQKPTNLTKPRAMVLSLILQYRKLGYDVSLLEVQKLAYFLQRIGQHDLNLKYKEYHYGPYAHNLQHLLHELEKGYIISERSILDSKPLDIIFLENSITEQITQYVLHECSAEEKSRLNKIFVLMSGFESPFGLELLATVDWIMSSNKFTQLSGQEIKQKIRTWSIRKDDIFSLDHVQSAKKRLTEFKFDLSYT